ncbi:MAG: ABC transporter ATP-binding protein [Clostridia bacterium]|nr:ABC transporter ATP-binding protein [Clostridia bacterium]
MNALEITGLTKRFGTFTAVDNLELSVPEGSVYGFLGPNGAGKTTTLKMITGLSDPTQGTIRIGGKEVRFGSSSGRESIGYLPDVPNFYGTMRPQEFLTFCGEIYGLDRKTLKTRVGELLELVGLKDVKRRIGGFSRGMKQRLGIAQALINQPKLVLLDEPASALDPIGRKDVMEIISRLAGKTTVFFSTHILADIERVCDRIAILNNGKLVKEDSMEALRREYAFNELEVEFSHPEEAQAFTLRIKKEHWLKSVKHLDHATLALSVSNLEQARLIVPSIVSEQHAALVSFKSREPSLEDIFLEVVKS